ncbi:MAG: PIG-L family deacetylase [Actinobacteria bacterium]|nr:PIG-L family deacetylase [Actinomycetota bacterium]
MGTDVRYVVLTDGASGSADPHMTRERLAVLREAEQRAACAALGVGGVEFLGYADGHLEPTIEARCAVAAEIRRHRPEVVVTLNPEMRWSERATSTTPTTAPSATSSCTPSTRRRRRGCMTPRYSTRSSNRGTSPSCGS